MTTSCLLEAGWYLIIDTFRDFRLLVPLASEFFSSSHPHKIKTINFAIIVLKVDYYSRWERYKLLVK